jgi:ribosome-binding factor A
MKTIGNSRKNELLKIKLSEILRRESSSDFDSVTIIKIESSPDMKTAHVFYSCFIAEDKEKIDRLLSSKTAHFQSRLGKTLKTRNTPKLSFIYDKGFDHSHKIQTLIDKINTEDKNEEDL